MWLFFCMRRYLHLHLLLVFVHLSKIATHFAQGLGEFPPRLHSRLNKVKQWGVLAKTTMCQREHHLRTYVIVMLLFRSFSESVNNSYLRMEPVEREILISHSCPPVFHITSDLFVSRRCHDNTHNVIMSNTVSAYSFSSTRA